MNILVTAAHPDDEILGVGGTIAKHVAAGDSVFVCIVSEGATARGGDVARQIECAKKACNELGVSKVFLLALPDQKLDTLPLLEITRKIEEVVAEVKPVIVYTHFYGDLNRDHQIVCEATLIAARPNGIVRKILCFETVSSTEWNAPQRMPFTPNVYVNIEDTFNIKLRALDHYTRTSANEIKDFPHPRSIKNLTALAETRGSAAGFKKAEAFMLVREINI